jgi:ParB family chromosome partitioning protein
MATILNVLVDRIKPNPDQPRRAFPEGPLNELADSIREKGIIQPILAEDQGDGTYIIVAGERRFRAAQIAGLDTIPVIPQELDANEKLEVALVENLQREDLNPIDQAIALKSVLDHTKCTQEELSQRIGISRPRIANTLRLLKLEPKIRTALTDGSLTAGHARALLSLDSAAKRKELFKRIQTEGLSVREAEVLAQPDDRPTADSPQITEHQESLEVPGSPAPAPRKSVELQQIEDKLVHALGTRVVIRGTNKSGKIEISYLSADDLERLLETFGVSLED